jgi:hypothetical protein
MSHTISLKEAKKLSPADVKHWYDEAMRLGDELAEIKRTAKHLKKLLQSSEFEEF